jgi:hypothetical protein
MKNYKDIVEKYKILFETRGSNFSLFGFECDIGWYDIIENACYVICANYLHLQKDSIRLTKELDNIDETIKQTKCIFPEHSDEQIIENTKKWLATTNEYLEKEKESLPKIVQIKEKFGTLRFYTCGGTGVHQAIADYAENMSSVTCEKCGNAARTYRIGWHRTLCRDHAIENYSKEEVDGYLPQTY